jgi:hypothetical protein
VTDGSDEQNVEDGPADDSPAEYEMPTVHATVEWFSRPDPVLQDIVGVANIGPGLPVTLYLPWGIVSGHVESGDRFFADAAATMRSGGDDPQEDDADESLVEVIARRSFDPWSEHISEDERMRLNLQQGYDLTTFMHLNNVQTFLHGWNQWQTHDHMRIRLSAVTGWAYGMMRGST